MPQAVQAVSTSPSGTTEPPNRRAGQTPLGLGTGVQPEAGMHGMLAVVVCHAAGGGRRWRPQHVLSYYTAQEPGP